MTDENDGGYYAIKGFLYQFDKSMLEVLENPEAQIGIEQKQDVDYQDFVIQVKHKETQDYKDYKIRKPVLQLLEMFKSDQTQKFCLYCHFKDKNPLKWVPQITELDSILGDQADNYTSFLKEKFIESFYIQFSENYEIHFRKVIELIKSSFSLTHDDLAYIYHSLFQSKLLDISIKAKNKRKISKHDLASYINAAEKTIFYTSYSKYLDKAQYERLVKKEFFTFKAINIENFERLFVIHCDERTQAIELSRVVHSLMNKYFKTGKSPQPYICFYNLDEQNLVTLKRDLLDQGIFFDDGTYFNGDRFRLEGIIDNELDTRRSPGIKIINNEYLDRVFGKVKFHEIYQFYFAAPIFIETKNSHIRIQIDETRQILRMIN